MDTQLEELPGLPDRLVPLAAKLAYTALMLVWVPVYWVAYGPTNFLWFCDVGNFVLLAALWLESPLLVSATAVMVLVFQLLWTLDWLVALLLGMHPIGGTEYMFEASQPLALRALSLFHVAVPPILLGLIARLGFHRRGVLVATAISWILVPVSYGVRPDLNLNWIRRPFNIESSPLPDLVHIPIAMVILPAVLFTATHLALRSLARARGWRIFG